MTEYCGMCAILSPELIHYGAVGLPVSSVHIKFRDVPDAGLIPKALRLLQKDSATRSWWFHLRNERL